MVLILFRFSSEAEDLDISNRTLGRNPLKLCTFTSGEKKTLFLLMFA